MKRIIALSLSLCLAIAVHAQLHLEADLNSNHLWRGMEVADGVVITSDATYTTLGGHVTFGLWGGTNARGTYKELNHHLAFHTGGFQLALWDTYNFSPAATYNNRQYFNYSARTTGRFLDATASYRFAHHFPLLLSWSTVVFGRDRNVRNTQNKYSTFVYAEYPLYARDAWQLDAGVGGAFALNRAGDSSHFYGTTPGVVHAALRLTRDVTLGKWTLPIHVQALWNPQSNQGFFQIGARLLAL